MKLQRSKPEITTAV